MAGLMLDSDDPSVLLEPRFSAMRIATYADLITPEIIAAAGPRLTVIDRGHGDPHNLATVADIEPALLTVDQGIAKIRQWLEEGRRGVTAYHDRAQWNEVNQAGAGLEFSHWIATLDGTLVPAGFYMAAVQFAGESLLGFHADMSIVWNDEWHPLPAGPTAAQLASLKQLAATVTQGATQLLHEIGTL